MRFALFEATAPTGRHLIEEALKQGHNLSVYTRGAKKLEAFGSKNRYAYGDCRPARCARRSTNARTFGGRKRAVGNTTWMPPEGRLH